MCSQISILGCGWLGLALADHLVGRGFRVKGSTTREERLGEVGQVGAEAFVVRASGSGVDCEPPGFFDSPVLVIDIPPGRGVEVERDYPRLIGRIGQRFMEAKGRKILFVSTTGVYGAASGEVDETGPTLPDKPSGRAVLKAETVLGGLGSLQLTVLRLAGLVGPGREPGRFLAGRRELANGAAPVNLVHRDDCLAAIAAIVDQGRWNEIYNLCAEGHPTRADFYAHQAQQLGLDPPSFKADGQGSGKVVKASRIKSQLGLVLLHPEPMDFEFG